MADEVVVKNARSKSSKWWLFVIVAVLSIAADQATKYWGRGLSPDVKLSRGTGPGGECVDPTDWLPADAKTHSNCTPYRYTFLEPWDPPAELTRVNRTSDADKAKEAGFWHWQKSWNPGSAFGLFGSLAVARVLLSLVGIGAVIGMIFMLKKSRDDQRILHWALALVAGGAVGNLIDRMYFGAVTDFISWDLKFMVWPTFNVADIVLVVGVGLMFIDIQIEGKREKLKKAARQEKAKAAGLVKDLEA